MIFVLFIGIQSFGYEIDATRYAEDFDAAYTTYPNIPKGLLEGVTFAQTQIRHIEGNAKQGALNFITNNRISITHLAQGVYHVKLQIGDRVFTEKLVKE